MMRAVCGLVVVGPFLPWFRQLFSGCVGNVVWLTVVGFFSIKKKRTILVWLELPWWMAHPFWKVFIYLFFCFFFKWPSRCLSFLFRGAKRKGEECCGGFGDGVEIKNKIQTKKALLQMLMLLWWHECWMQGRRSWARYLFFSFFAFGVCWLFFSQQKRRFAVFCFRIDFFFFLRFQNKKKKAHCENMSLSGASHTNSKGPTQNPRYIISSSLSLPLSRCANFFIYLTFYYFFYIFFQKENMAMPREGPVLDVQL